MGAILPLNWNKLQILYWNLTNFISYFFFTIFQISSHLYHQFLSISYFSNSEYWSQKLAQSGNIHSTELAVYAVKQSTLSLSFILSQHK